MNVNMNNVNNLTSNVLKVSAAACMITSTGVLVIGGAVGGVRLYKLSKTAERTLQEGTVTLREIGDASKEAKLALQGTRVVISNVGEITTTVNTTLQNLGETLNKMGITAQESLSIFNQAFSKVVNDIDMTKYRPQIQEILNSISKAINSASRIADQLDVKLVNEAIKGAASSLHQLKETIEKVKNGDVDESGQAQPGSIIAILKTLLGVFTKLNSGSQPT